MQDIGALETYVDQTAVVMIFVSRGYFKSKNCLREVRCTVEKQKRITLVHDSAVYLSTFMPLETIKADECPDDLRGPVFDGRTVIEWHRIKDFQLVSLKLLAEQLLLGCPDQAPGPIALYIPKEVSRQKLVLRKRLVLYASKNNPGARAVAEDLARVMGGAVQVTGDPAAIKPPAAAARQSRLTVTKNGRLSLSGARRRTKYFLLYLNDKTYLGAAGQQLMEELRAALAAGSDVQIVMVHENDMERGGCNFGIFFDGRTPGDLLQACGTHWTCTFLVPPSPFRPWIAGRAVHVPRPRALSRRLLARVRRAGRQGPRRRRRRLQAPRLRVRHGRRRPIQEPTAPHKLSTQLVLR